MGQVGLKFGGRAWPMRQARTRKVVATQRRETQTLTKKKKKTDPEKKGKKNQFGHRGARPHGLPKRPWGLPFGPQMRPDSGFSYQL